MLMSPVARIGKEELMAMPTLTLSDSFHCRILCDTSMIGKIAGKREEKWLVRRTGNKSKEN
jgi:hypothetical protein